MKNFLRKLINIFDDNLFDFVLLTGICGLFYGLYMRNPWIAYVVVGSLLIILAIAGMMFSRESNKQPGKGNG